MARIKDLPEERSMCGHWARWMAAPYCEFKDDRARLLALIARDIRKVSITLVLALTGASLPWRAWIGVLLG